MMDDAAFDRALVSAAFTLAAQDGWARVSVAEAARRGGLPLDRARARFPMRSAILLRFGRIADQTALADLASDDASPVRDRLFDLLMRRFDALQAHREGVIALLSALPANPPTALLLGLATLRSMGWMLEAAGISAHGPLGALRAKALTAVWVQAVRAWSNDRSPDLSGTMAALDKALGRAERLASWLPGRSRRAAGESGPPDQAAPAGADQAGVAPPSDPPDSPPSPSPNPGASEADPGTLPPQA